MIESKTDTKVPKTEEEQLKHLIDSVVQVLKRTKPKKSEPLLQLYRDGQLNYDFVIKEAVLISQKKSNLPVGKRMAIFYLLKTAITQFKQNQASSKQEQDVSN